MLSSIGLLAIELLKFSVAVEKPPSCCKQSKGINTSHSVGLSNRSNDDCAIMTGFQEIQGLCAIGVLGIIGQERSQDESFRVVFIRSRQTSSLNIETL